MATGTGLELPVKATVPATWLKGGWQWTRDTVMAHPEFVAAQQDSERSGPDTSHWFVGVRVQGISISGTLENCRARLIPRGFEPPNVPSAGLKDNDQWRRPLDLRWQYDPKQDSERECHLHKGKIYRLPIANRTIESGNRPAITQLTTERFFGSGENPLNESGFYYFQIEITSGGGSPWTSKDLFQIDVPNDRTNNGHFCVQLCAREQYLARLGDDGARQISQS